MNCQIQPEGVPFSYTKGLFDKQVTSRNPIAIPFRLKKEKVLPADQLTFLSNDSTYIANLSDKSRAYLASLGISDPDNPAPLENNLPAYALIWLHALAVGFSPAYLRENADGVRQDYPRIPLPASRAHLFASAALGKQIAALLDSDIPLPGVTSGEIRPDLKSIARLRRVDESQIDPQRGDLALTAGWGHSGKDGVVMPGQGKIVAGGGSLDVYLNDSVYWQNIPSEVWEYAIGGYQVIKKWLSYRENKILGRALTVEEAREVTGIARRLTAIIALHPSLDANYLQIKENLYPWD